MEVIIDTGAAISMIGEYYLDQLFPNVGDKQRSTISKSQEGKRRDFKFGNGKPSKALEVIHIPVHIQNEERKLKFYVLPGNVPCLLGVQALMKLGVTISGSLPAIKLHGKKLNVRETNAGHSIWQLEKSTSEARTDAVCEMTDKRKRVVIEEHSKSS